MPGRKRDAHQAGLGQLAFRPAPIRPLRRNAPIPITMVRNAALPANTPAPEPEPAAEREEAAVEGDSGGGPGGDDDDDPFSAAQDAEMLFGLAPGGGDDMLPGGIFAESATTYHGGRNGEDWAFMRDDRPLREPKDETAFSAIADKHEFAPMVVGAKPLSNDGWRSHCLAQVQLCWRGSLEEHLWSQMQPTGPAKDWPRKLLKPLAELVWLGEPDDINGLLWQKVRERPETGNSVLTKEEALAVLADLKGEGRKPEMREMGDMWR